ncbi:FecR family protein [Filimonas effusa]|uniref:DUF4974 domain-containing protein n=1 Tax=Filimonas effusa TaxID=2508721 RepID=A0A4Q1DAD8_9BACT|nr:FecR domain-containing protein [Filimonas effusa]RXK85513.1 DUF4974 domain-containing protein [Filimonas effusa]
MNLLQERLQLLAMLVLDNQATEAEQQELNEILIQYPEMEAELVRIRQTYHFQSPVSSIPDADTAFSRHLERLAGRVPAPTSSRKKNRTLPMRLAGWMIAGSAAAACAFFIYNRNNHLKTIQEPQQYETVLASHGSKRQIQLPDGTNVWLNADSKLTYNADFRKGERVAWLTGEAFFDVKKDAARPMIIHTSNMKIKVLGTSFNVRSYGNEKTAETVLVSGAVEVSLKVNPESKIRLIPGNKLVVANRSSTGPGKHGSTPSLYWIDRIEADPSDTGSIAQQWTRPGLSFRGESLEGAISRLEHWFNIHIIIDDAQLKQGTYTGDFKDETLEQVLEALQLTGNFTYKIQKDSVILYKR